MFLEAMLSQAFKLESMPGQKSFLSFSVFEASYQGGKGEGCMKDTDHPCCAVARSENPDGAGEEGKNYFLQLRLLQVLHPVARNFFEAWGIETQ